jgi:hypothetical protein
MNDKVFAKYSNLLPLWTASHSLKYFEKYEDREISTERAFEYIDGVQSNILSQLFHVYSFSDILREFLRTLEEQK